jgi:hypothetical protein
MIDETVPTADEDRSQHMFNGRLKACLFVGTLLLAPLAASGQEVVHALTGTVASVDATAKTISVFTDNRSSGLFKDLTNSKSSLVSDKSLRAVATPADDFKKQGTYGIVFFFGGSDMRSAVALRSFGQGPFSRTEGTVSKFEDREHSFSVTDDSGAVKTFKIASDTVAETSFGAVAGYKIQVHKGDKVVVTSKAVDGSDAALFVNIVETN